MNLLLLLLFCSFADLEIFHEQRNFVGGASNAIQRADVARFMLRCLKTDEFNKQWVAIGVKP